MANSHQDGDSGTSKPVWRMPTISDDNVVEVTLGTFAAAGSDGNDAIPGYSTTGAS